MQTQNVTASHQQTRISYFAVTVCHALPHLVKTSSNSKTFVSDFRTHFLENLSCLLVLHRHSLQMSVILHRAIASK